MTSMSSPFAFLEKMLRAESSVGILLMISALLALICANTSLEPYYQLLLSTPVEFKISDFEIAKPLLLWINDGMMALFFFLVGLELKRELMGGELSHKSNIILPAVGAIGGMLIPAVIYLFINRDDPSAQSGWAIPAATDIAFAMGVLALVGSKVPVSLKLFLTSLAIFDDVGAILIIAFFYASKISFNALIISCVCLSILFLLNRMNVESKSSYALFGFIMWVSILKSGVHATLAGALLALFIPLQSKHDPKVSPLVNMEKDLHTLVYFIILPMFAFANAGLNLKGVGIEQLLHSVPLGIALGLFIGKPLGIFGFCWVFIKLKWVNMPKGVNWLSLFGTSVLCGVGFTMSLFIGSLAFDENGLSKIFDERLGILLGSISSGFIGYWIVRWGVNSNPSSEPLKSEVSSA